MMEDLSKMDNSPPSRVNSTEAVNLIAENTINGNVEKRDASSPHNVPQNLSRGSSHLANRPFSSRSFAESQDADASLGLLFPFDPDSGTRSSVATTSSHR